MEKRELYKMMGESIKCWYNNDDLILELSASLNYAFMSLDELLPLKKPNNPLYTLSYILTETVNDYYVKKSGKMVHILSQWFEIFFESHYQIFSLSSDLSLLISHLKEPEQAERINALTRLQNVLISTIQEYFVPEVANNEIVMET